MNSKVLKLALFGAAMAVATDYFIGPALRKNLNLPR